MWKTDWYRESIYFCFIGLLPVPVCSSVSVFLPHCMALLVHLFTYPSVYKSISTAVHAYLPIPLRFNTNNHSDWQSYKYMPWHICWDIDRQTDINTNRLIGKDKHKQRQGWIYKYNVDKAEVLEQDPVHKNLQMYPRNPKENFQHIICFSVNEYKSMQLAKTNNWHWSISEQ